MSTIAPATGDRDPYAVLADADPGLGALVAAHGRPDPFAWGPLDDAVGRDDAFGELVLHIVSQQISTRAALTIFGRLRGGSGGDLRPEAVAARTDEQLRAAGLSVARARALRDLAERLLDGRLSFDRLAASDDAAALEELQTVRGVGPWSARMFLLHRYRRPDVLPSGDVGLQRGAQAAFGLERRPTPDELAARAEAWRPFRSYAAALLWTHAATLPRESPGRRSGG